MLLAGAHLKRFRKLVGLRQADFAERLGLTQSSLSKMENGLIALDEDCLARILKVFDSEGSKPRFSEFLKTLVAEAATGQAALTDPFRQYVTVVVWPWDGFDFSRIPHDVEGVVTVKADVHHRVVALHMERRSDHWIAGDTLVFEEVSPADLKEGQLCLVQVRLRPNQPPRTLVTRVASAPGPGGKVQQHILVVPSGPPFIADGENLLVSMRLICIIRYFEP